MENVKKDLKSWKANVVNARKDSNVSDIEFSRGVVFGLELALSHINEKNNKKLNPKQAGGCPIKDSCKKPRWECCERFCPDFPPEG